MADKVYPETPSLVSPEKKLESSESTVESTRRLERHEDRGERNGHAEEAHCRVAAPSECQGGGVS